MPNGWPTVEIRIRPDGSVDKEECHLSKSQHEQVSWISDGGEVEIEFQHTPFEYPRFHVPAGGAVRSGPVRGEVGAYEYTIRQISLAHAYADPLIVVDP